MAETKKTQGSQAMEGVKAQIEAMRLEAEQGHEKLLAEIDNMAKMALERLDQQGELEKVALQGDIAADAAAKDRAAAERLAKSQPKPGTGGDGDG